MPPRSSAYGFLVAALALFGCQAPPKDLPAASAPTTEARLVESRRIAGSPEPFAQIGAFAFGAHGEVALVDGERSKVLVFDSAGHLQREFGSAGNGPGEFRNAHLVAIAPDGEVMVADIGNARLTRWSPAGKLIASTPLPTPAAALEWTDSGFAGAVDRGTGRVLFRIHPGSAGRDSLQSFARFQVADPLDHPPEAVTCETCALIITPELRALVSAPDTIYRVALTDREGKPIREWRREGVPPRPAARAKLERAKKLLGPSGLSALPAALRFATTVRNIGLDAEGKLYVLRGEGDSPVSMIDRFDVEGRFMRTDTLPGLVTTMRVTRAAVGVALADSSSGFVQLVVLTPSLRKVSQ